MTTIGWPSAPATTVGRRPKLARLCSSTGLLAVAGRMRTFLRNDLRILAYHRVLDSVEPAGFTFDVDLISASAEAFRQQLALLKRRYHPIRFDELLDALDRGRSLPPRAVLVTFDDGYDDNRRIAYPILREMGLPAMFFVSTGYIDSRQPFAYDWLVHMVCTTAAQAIDLPELQSQWPLPATLPERRVLASRLLDRIKSLDAQAQESLIARLEREWSMPRAAGHVDCRPMGWDDLREMQRGGMEIGSHGVDHRMLAKLSAAEMRWEVGQSKAALERELGAAVTVLSYPVGGVDAWDAGVIAAAQAAGYRMACTYLPGNASIGLASRYAMRRFPVEREMDAPWFEAMLVLPEIFAYQPRSRID